MLQAYRAHALLQRLSPQLTTTNNVSTHSILNAMHTPTTHKLFAALCCACDPVAKYKPVAIWLHHSHCHKQLKIVTVLSTCDGHNATTETNKTLRSAPHPSAVRTTTKSESNKPNSVQMHWSQKSTSGFRFNHRCMQLQPNCIVVSLCPGSTLGKNICPVRYSTHLVRRDPGSS